MIPRVYLDSSVLLRKLFHDPEAVSPWGHWERCFTSRLAEVECLRVLDRRRLGGALSDVEIAGLNQKFRELLDCLELVELSEDVIHRAAQSFPVQVGTLDAIHVSSAILVKEGLDIDLVFLTHDVQQGLAAQAMGLKTQGFKIPRS
ncbi:MAG: type II toxin-antitoxin system VapC family toxin [Elusimicrobiota bacterium]